MVEISDNPSERASIGLASSIDITEIGPFKSVSKLSLDQMELNIQYIWRKVSISMRFYPNQMANLSEISV